jgi:hypothetical protein
MNRPFRKSLLSGEKFADKKPVFRITTVRLNNTKLLRKLSSKLIEWFVGVYPELVEGLTMTAQSMYSVWKGAAPFLSDLPYIAVIACEVEQRLAQY